MNHFDIKLLKERLLQPLPGRPAQELMVGRVRPMPFVVPDNAMASAVLCLFFPAGDTLKLVLIKRKEDKRAHSGQVSFPGGRYEPSDINYQTTALRETFEEVGIPPEKVDVIGSLTSLYIPVSNFNVFPFVGFVQEKPDYFLNNHEVAYVMEVPLQNIFHPDRKTIAEVTSPIRPEVAMNVNAYKLEDGTVIWGATAMILSELEVILRELGFLMAI